MHVYTGHMKMAWMNALSQLSGVSLKMSMGKVIRVKGEIRGIAYLSRSCTQRDRRGSDTVTKNNKKQQQQEEGRSIFHAKGITLSSRVPVIGLTRRYSSATTETNEATGLFESLDGALSGITVLDLTRVLAGPFCTQFLGDLGAQIIKVEEPTKGDDTRGYGPPFFKDGPDGSKNSAYYVSVNRNKESIAINLKDARGVQLIHQLASKADVVIENFTPGVASRLGIGFDSLSKVNDKLIYCSISGFGQSGAYSTRPGYDVIASSIGGLLSITGPENGDPCRPGVPVIDQITGLYAITAILAALYRQRTLQLINILDGQFNCNNDTSPAHECQDVKRESAVTRIGKYVSSSSSSSSSTGSPSSGSSSREIRANCSPVSNDCNEASVQVESSNLCMHSESRVKLRQLPCRSGPVNIDVNLLSSQISVLINIALNYLNFNLIANRRGTAHETIVPYQAFACKSSDESHETRPSSSSSSSCSSSSSSSSPDYLTVIAGNDSMFPKLIKLLFADDLQAQQEILKNDKFKNNAERQVNRNELVSLLQKQFSTKTRSQWIELLSTSGLPYGPVNKIDQVFTDENIKSQTTFTRDDITYLKNAVKFDSRIPFERRQFIPPPARPGQDTRTVLTKLLNVDDDYLQQLASSGVIRL